MLHARQANPALPRAGAACHDGVWSRGSTTSLGEWPRAETKASTFLMIIAPMLADFAIRLAFGLAVATRVDLVENGAAWFLPDPGPCDPGPLGTCRPRPGTGGRAELGTLERGRGRGRGLCRRGRVGVGPAQVRRRRLRFLSHWSRPPGWPRRRRSATSELWAFNTASRLSSGFLLGTTLTAMLLGHHYLTAPAMSIDPLKRIVTLMAWSLGRAACSPGLGCGLPGPGPWAWAPMAKFPTPRMFLAARWGMGFVGTAIATYMTWKTAQIRSTQSATGILYITMIFVLFGELTSMILAGRGGVIC